MGNELVIYSQCVPFIFHIGDAVKVEGIVNSIK